MVGVPKRPGSAGKHQHPGAPPEPPAPRSTGRTTAGAEELLSFKERPAQTKSRITTVKTSDAPIGLRKALPF